MSKELKRLKDMRPRRKKDKNKTRLQNNCLYRL
jgi:hypothetical protein